MIRSPSIASIAFTGSLFIAAVLSGPAFAADTAKIKRGQWPSLEAGATKSGGDVKAPSIKPGAANPARQAPEKMTPAGQLNALSACR
jgi:hypothetical protein